MVAKLSSLFSNDTAPFIPFAFTFTIGSLGMHTLVALVVLSLHVGASIAEDCEGAEICTLPDGDIGFCQEKKCSGHIHVEERQNLTFSITVKYPEAELQKHGRSSLYIRGNGLGLLWIKGRQLVKTGNDMWKTDITYKSSLNGFRCQACADQAYLPDNKLQYRIMADDREDMLGANSAVNFPISETSSYFDEKPNYITYPWFNEKTGSFQNFVIQSKHIGESRNVTIYTPPSFNENTYKTYPTILVFDLTFDFAKLFKRYFEDPILSHAVSKEFVLIGFGDYKDNGRERYDILTQTAGPFLDCINGTFKNNCDGCIPESVTANTTDFFKYLRDKCGKRSIIGGRGDNTLDFLIYEVLPFANNLVNTRLQTDNLGVMGYSLGGLMSCYAAWTRPHVISLAACQSPSLWWPYNDAMTDANFDFINKTLKDSSFQGNRTYQRIYLDAGGAENIDLYRLTQSVVEVGEMLTNLGNYKLNGNVWVAVDPLKTHTYVEWANRMGQALAILLPADGAPRMPVMSDVLVG